MPDVNYKHIGERGFNGLPQADIDAETFNRLSTHRKHIVMHSGDWVAEDAQGEIVNPYKDMKRADLDAAASEFEIDPTQYDRAEDLRDALLKAYEKGAR